MSVPANPTLTSEVTRGDVWAGLTVTFNKTGFDFTGTTVASHLRSDSEAGLAVAVPVTIVSAAVGSLVCGLSLSAAATAALPEGDLYGDVQITHALLGPLTPFTYRLTVKGDFTR